ncbi:MAG: acyltransferase [Bacteroidales bacterium]|nr:acyltransferase [Bacteroidales bacterium]
MKTETLSPKKDASVETLRGFAIILVVLGHVIGSDSGGGMRVSDDSFLRYIYYTFEYLRMPLFTVISGWVYALRPASKLNFKSFTMKKVRRIIYPMIFVGATYYLLQYFTPGTNAKSPLQDIWQIVVFPYTLYWYLPSLFIVFLLISGLDALKAIETKIQWAYILLAAVIFLIVRDQFIPEAVPNYFSFKGAVYLLPFFIIGVGLKRFKDIFANRYLNFSLLAILAFSLLIQQLSWFDVIDYELSKRNGIGLLIGITGTILFFKIKWRVNWLIWFGSYAYTIYLFHSFGTSGGRILIKAAGISNTFSVFIVSLLLGLLLPVLIEKILDPIPLTRMLFLGRSYTLKNRKPFLSKIKFKPVQE